MYHLSLRFKNHKKILVETFVTKKVSIVLRTDGIKKQNKRKSG
jgi:hypothetical protein